MPQESRRGPARGPRPGHPGYGDGSSNTKSAPPSGLAATICSPIFPKNGGVAHGGPQTNPTVRLPASAYVDGLARIPEAGLHFHRVCAAFVASVVEAPPK